MSAYPPEGTVRVLVTPEVMEQMVVRDHLGRRLTWDWGEPNEFGDHTPTISVALDDPSAQDIEDGAALRRLREALPGSAVTVGPGWTQRDTGQFVMTVSVEKSEPSLTSRRRHFTRAWGEGPTIAEAADACRAALEGKP